MGARVGHAGWFDIDWQPDRFSLRDKLLVPFLGKAIRRGAVRRQADLKFDAAGGIVRRLGYDAHKLPVCPLHYQRILGDAHPELERLGDAFATLRGMAAASDAARPRAEGGTARSRATRCDAAERPFEAARRSFNGTPGVEESWNELNALIQDQHWRVAHFRVAGDDINYRRFFDINELAGLRMELPEVFEHAHALVFQLLERQAGRLAHRSCRWSAEPKEYLRRL